MDQFASFIGYLFRLAIGISVFVGLMYYALRAISHYWRATAEAYAFRPRSAWVARKFPESIVITQRSDSRGIDRFMKGWHTFAPAFLYVYEDGLALTMFPPFNFMCTPLFLPFSELEMHDTWWALWPQPVALRMKRAPEIDIIIGRDTKRWLRDQVTGLGRGGYDMLPRGL